MLTAIYRRLNMTNTGDYNTGDYNTGNYNTGDYNTGDCNIGNYNTGDYNTGDYNTGDCNTWECNTGSFHTGSFNTSNAKQAYYFNKPCDKALWDNSSKPSWIYSPRPTTWVPASEMSDIEKSENPGYIKNDGYLRKNDMKEEWEKAYNSATEEEIQMVRDLPNFCAEVFKEITGLDLYEQQGH
jgi:hypothetical protein